MGSLSNPNAFSGIVKNSDSGGNDFPVNITNPQEGQILTFDSESEEWVNSDANDFPVNITNPQEGQILTFDNVNGEWVNIDIDDDSLYDIIINFDYNDYGLTDETAPVVSGYSAIKGFSCNKSFDEVLVIYNNRDINTPKIKIIAENFYSISSFNYMITPDFDANEQINDFEFIISSFNDNFNGILIGEHFYQLLD